MRCFALKSETFSDSMKRVACKQQGCYLVYGRETAFGALPETRAGYTIKEKRRIMRIQSGQYVMRFVSGGVEIQKNGETLYDNRRPLYASVKTAYAVTEFYDVPYGECYRQDAAVIGKGVLETPGGSALAFTDTYRQAEDGFRVDRSVSVQKAGDDIGFSTKVSFLFSASNDIKDFHYFAPAQWYRQNQFTNPGVMGYDLEAEYYWRRETHYPLPLFAAQHISSGETVMLSRWTGDVKPCSHDLRHSENTVDPTVTVGAIGISKPLPKTLDVLYYGFEVRKDNPVQADGLNIDYVYPGADGQMPRRGMGYHVDYMKQSKTVRRMFHPLREGFTHSYGVGIHTGCYDGYYAMMRSAWRSVYARLKDPVFQVDQEQHYRSCMESLTSLTKQYGDAWGLPFACQLPAVDPSSISFQFGFVGQQPGIGYQLLRYGDKENRPVSYQKGINVIDFWVRTSMTEIGAPMNCYNPTIQGFEPLPFWTRMIADGLENILDAYVYMKKKGEEKSHWLAYLKKAADWLVRVQNSDGSYYRAYNTQDGSMRMDSKANTVSVVRFLIQIFLVTKDTRYKQSALRAGEWSYDNIYQNMEYRGSTCDNTDIMDNESGIYAMFGFLALYDLTGEERWLKALLGAADYTETWTYAWSFPVRTLLPNHPFTKNRISGQSPVTIGNEGGGDMYMAACAYLYYRLYIITGDAHYRDFAEFIHQNTRHMDGSFGIVYPGLSHEGGNFGGQDFLSQFHWLPWVTYVEIDPTSRLVDTFGAYDIAGCERLSPEEREKRNRIYDCYL